MTTEEEKWKKYRRTTYFSLNEVRRIKNNLTALGYAYLAEEIEDKEGYASNLMTDITLIKLNNLGYDLLAE